jgi:hypothetical protein
MKSSKRRDAATTSLGMLPDLLTEQGTESAGLEILHVTTSDIPDGRPWPPPNSDALWRIVRRVNGRTLWRAIQLGQVRSAAADALQNPYSRIAARIDRALSADVLRPVRRIK